MWLLKDARKAYREDPNAVAQLTIGIAKLLRLQERPKRALYQLKKTPRFMNQDGRILFERIKSYEQLNKPKRISKALASYVKYSNSAYEQIGSHPDISTLILAEARLGEVEAVKQRLDELKPFEDEIPYLAILRVQATTQLGQLEHAWNLVKDPSFDKARERYWSYDPCDDEEIAPLTSDPRFAKRFPECRYN